ncbi:hypothetical protein BDF20DRAFT_999040 [Mycotypha africana]|uniref:uncharacterized protein n=1 Tax=Mycotypha africana TaxID=64632 RepID=UPI002301FA72|nr:uncharacterized protein BDF20DRAFT_999040 [Mycotypha africana]KAI8983924.1 hypothetical protein BDF20DRAFT_999040 [Mycotypha africana]
MSTINSYFSGRKLRPRNESHKAITKDNMVSSALQQPDSALKKSVTLAKPLTKPITSIPKQKQKRNSKNSINRSNSTANILYYMRKPAEASKPSVIDNECNSNENSQPLHPMRSVEEGGSLLKEDDDSDDEVFCKIRKPIPFKDYWQAILNEFDSAACIIESPYQSPCHKFATENDVEQLALPISAVHNQKKRKSTYQGHINCRNVRSRTPRQPVTCESIFHCYEDLLSDGEDDENNIEDLRRPLRSKYTLEQSNELLRHIIQELLPYEHVDWFRLN